ncbi:MAG TPA: HNH endonuclease [Polyangiaceae bacterium]|nr:HNH endonuclease [Polyangiaceae bacterium]
MIAHATPLQLESTAQIGSGSQHPERSESGYDDIGADCVTLLARGASARLAHLSDSELLTRTQDLAGKANQLLAALLDHLAEVEARGLHRQRACSSLYTYCIYELRFSEDAAARRSSAAKLARRFPAILLAVSAGEIHLTGLLMLGPHLSDENHLKLLSLAKFRTKKEISKLIRRVAPLPPVPDRVEPLGALTPSQPNPTWAEFIESLCPPVRELPSRKPSFDGGPNPEGAGDAVETADARRIDRSDRCGGESTALARRQSVPCEADDLLAMGKTTQVAVAEGMDLSSPPGRESSVACEADDLLAMGETTQIAVAEGMDLSGRPGRESSVWDRDGGDGTALARRENAGAPWSDAVQLYFMQFTTTEEHAELVERARALLSHDSTKVSLGELHLRALRLLIESLEKKRFGSKEATESRGSVEHRVASVEASRKRHQGSRYIPARIRRAVYERDGGRCAYIDERGVRCGEAHHLEVHHLQPFAIGGEHVLRNLGLRCRAHNALAAEQDFGGAYMKRQRERDRREAERQARGGVEIGEAAGCGASSRVEMRRVSR